MATTNVSLKNIFHRGQAFAFTVAQEKRKSSSSNSHCVISICPYDVNNHLIPTTLLPNSVLNGIVSSIEEKGAIIDLGFSNCSVKGFVQAEHLPPYLKLENLFIGQVVMFAVKERPGMETRVIKLTGFAGLETLDDFNEGSDGKQLMPGTVLQVKPEKVVFDGVFVGLPNGSKSYIRKVHMAPRLRFDPDQISKPFRACVIFSQPNTSLLVLSAHPDIIRLFKLEKRFLHEEFKAGSTSIGTIYHIDKKQNLYFKFAGAHELITAKCLRINIENFEENENAFKIGSEHQFRIIGYSAVERQLNVSMKKEDMKRRVVCAENAVPGAKLSGKIKFISENGIVVDFGYEFTGFVGAMHVLDRPKKNWQRLFCKGQTIACRVLFSDPISNKLMLTTKPSMVKKQGSEKLITTFDNKHEGSVATGVVIKLLEGGSLLVAFYNRVAGVLRKHELAALPDEAKEIGATIKVRVQSVNKELSQMFLELPNVVPSAGLPVGLEEKTKKEQQQGKSQSKLSKPAKPFRLYTAEVVGAWPYGGTSAATTAELLLPGGSVGRLHASELNNLVSDYAEGSCPMQQFLESKKGKLVNVKVLAVSKNKAITPKGKELLAELRKSDRVVECTARLDKLQEPRKKLSLLNYRSTFNYGNIIPVFIVAKPLSDKTHICGEINPDFAASIPIENIKINSKLECLKNSSSSHEELFDSGEIRFGKVVGVSKTKKSRMVLMELVDAPLSSTSVDVEQVVEMEKTNKLNASTNAVFMESKDETDSLSDEDIPLADSDNEDEDEGNSTSNQEHESINSDDGGDNQDFGSATEFEQQFLAHPNSILRWVDYVQFYTKYSDKQIKSKRNYELGKDVVERALKTITFENSADAYKIWKVFLSLEVQLGTARSLKDCFKRACAATEPIRTHKYLIGLLKQQTNAEGREKEIRVYFESLIKNTRCNVLDPWLAFAKHLLQRNDRFQVGDLLRRALLCMEKRKHLVLIKGFARLEAELGDAEKAKTMQELIKNYKAEGKQLDINSLEKAIGARR